MRYIYNFFLIPFPYSLIFYDILTVGECMPKCNLGDWVHAQKYHVQPVYYFSFLMCTSRKKHLIEQMLTVYIIWKVGVNTFQPV